MRLPRPDTAGARNDRVYQKTCREERSDAAISTGNSVFLEISE